MKLFTLIKNALLMPLDGSMDAFASGVFDGQTCVPGSLMSRAVAARPVEPEEELTGTCLFGGYMFGHFGHFLLESLSRVYALRQCRPAPLLFMSPNDFIATGQRLLLKRLGLNQDIRLIKKPTRVAALLVSPPGSSVEPDFLHDEQLRALAIFQAPPLRPERKIWLSRSNFKGGGLDNESWIEERLAERGWEILHPESQDIQEQVWNISSAGHVAGLDGSAFYTALLADTVRGRFSLFSRRNAIPSTLTYMLDRKKVETREYVFPADYTGGEGAASRFMLREPERIVAALEEA